MVYQTISAVPSKPATTSTCFTIARSHDHTALIKNHGDQFRQDFSGLKLTMTASLIYMKVGILKTFLL